MTPEDWASFAARLRDCLGKDSVFDDETALQAYASDETRDLRFMPDLAVKPRSAEEVARILKICHAESVPITPRGGGSGVSGGALPVKGGVVLCLERLNRILDVNRRNMTIEVETGAITGEVQDHLLEQGLFLPPDPGSRSWCQIGGNLAEAAAGPKSVKYGAFRDYVLNLEAVLPNGDVIRTGADVRKYASGYNLTQLLLGSEGTLAVMTKVVFRVITAPTEEILLRLAFSSLENACELICRIFEQGLIPSEVEFIEADAIDIARDRCRETPKPGVAAYVWIGFDGNNAETLMEDATRVSDLAEALACDEFLVAQEPDQKRQLWAFRHEIGPAVIEKTPFRDVDLAFPREKLFEVVRRTKTIGQRYGFRTAIFGHAGDGNVHINVLRDQLDEAQWRGPVRDGIAELYKMAGELGGALSGEHGIGCTLTEYMETAFGKTRLELMRGIKKVFDPKGVLNPGKILN